MKTLINTFWQSSIVNGSSFLQTESAKRTRFLIQLVYFFIFISSLQTFSTFTQFPHWDAILESKHLFDPIWSAKWIPTENWELSVRTIMLSLLACSTLGVIAWSRSRIIRLLVFLSLFSYLSLISSFGKIDHSMHLMLLSSFLLIFIPNVDHSKEEDKLNLNKVFFGIQTLILLAYFVSGFFKIWGIIDQELGGLTSALASESMGLNLGKTMLASNSTYFLSDYVLNNPSPIFAFLLIAGYLIELFSIYVIFKPHYHRTWGILLILLHVGILLMVGPDFTSQIIIVGIFFVYSPFSKQGDIWGEVLAIIKNWKYRLQNRKNTKEIIIFYDGECLMCNGFLKYLAKFDLPSELRISTIQSERFEQLKATHTGLDEIDSIVILETDNNDQQTIRIKANGIVWVMGRIKKRFLLLKLAYKVFPLPGNVVYDIVAKNRKKADPNNCPIPPQNIREILLD